MKNNLLRISISTGLLVTASIISTSTMACSDSSPACPTGITAGMTLTSDCVGPLEVTGNDVTVNLAGHIVCNASGNGIEVSGKRVTIKNGYSRNNGDAGIWSDKVDTKIISVNLSHNDTWGAADIAKARTSIKHSTINNNDTDGVRSYGRRLSVSYSHINGNTSDGIDMNSNRGSFISNTTNNNTDTGISLDDVANTFVYFNRAYGNGDFDLKDTRTNCGTNVWLMNFAGAKNQNCIH